MYAIKKFTNVKNNSSFRISSHLLLTIVKEKEIKMKLKCTVSDLKPHTDTPRVKREYVDKGR